MGCGEGRGAEGGLGWGVKLGWPIAAAVRRFKPRSHSTFFRVRKLVCGGYPQGVSMLMRSLLESSGCVCISFCSTVLPAQVLMLHA